MEFEVTHNSKMLLLNDLASTDTSKVINYSVGKTEPNKT